MRDDHLRIADMLEAIERIDRYSVQGKHIFETDELIQTWVVHHLQILGEAARALSEDFKAAHQEIPWRRINAFRNILVHEYFGVDVERVWNLIENNLPAFKAQLRALDTPAGDTER